MKTEYLFDGKTSDIVKKALDSYLFYSKDKLTTEQTEKLIKFRKAIIGENREVIELNIISAL